MTTPAPNAAPRGGYISFARKNPRFLAFGFSLTLFSSLGQTYFISEFGDSIRNAFDLSAGDWGKRYGIATATSGLLLMWFGKYIDTMDLRRWTTAVLIGLVGACLLMAWTPTTTVLVIALFSMRFAGQGLMGHTSSTSMSRYFESERGRALTISGLGFALGFSIFPSIGEALLRWRDWREVWMVIAGVVALLVLPLARVLLRGHDERHAAWQRAVQSSHAQQQTSSSIRHWTRADVLRDWRFYCLLPGILACPFLMTGMIFFHDELALTKSWSRTNLSASMFMMGLSLYATSIIMGILVDRVGARRLLALTQIPIALGMWAVASIDHGISMSLYLIGAGMTMGSMGPVVGSIWPQLYGTRHLGSIRSLATSGMVMASAAAPWLFGALIDQGVGMRTIAGGGTLYAAMGALTLLIVARTRGTSQ